jgi:hypothetical protein
MGKDMRQTDPHAVGRTPHPGLVIGKAVHEEHENIYTMTEEYHAKPLHAVQVGALRALCGEAVVPVDPAPHTSVAWPPALGHTCKRCHEAVAAMSGGEPGPSEADLVNGRRPNP